MGLRINTNVSALNTHRQLTITDINMSRSTERLSSGYRINRARDDAAGLSMSLKFSAQVRSLSVASRNTTQANALLQTAEGGADQVHNMLIRLKELATQASSANSSSNLADIDAEAEALLNEIDRIAASTKYQDDTVLNGYAVKSLNSAYAGSVGSVANIYGWDVSGASTGTYTLSVGAAGSYVKITDTNNVSQTLTTNLTADKTYNFSTFGIKFSNLAAVTSNNIVSLMSVGASMIVTGTDASFQIGDANGSNYRIDFQINSMTKAALSVGNLNLTAIGDAQSSLDMVDNAIAALNTIRASIGAIQNRLDYTYANLATSIENLSSANSVIRDVDMAAEMVTFTKSQILLQAGTAMLAQANMAPQVVLQLLG